MPLNDRFLESVGRLHVPAMGTETVAPLLYYLVRFSRPQRVLEAGMGFTTPFLAQALLDNQRDAYAERLALISKTERHLRSDEPLGDEWRLSPPSLASPDFYAEVHDPALVTIDDLSVADSSAPAVGNVLAELDLSRLTTVINAPLADARSKIPARLLPFDFVWVDAWVALEFIENWWQLVADDGGLIAFHYLLTYEQGAAILDYLKSTQEIEPNEFELLSMREPHKLAQNSLTLLRKTRAYSDPRYTAPQIRSAVDRLVQPPRQL